MANEDHVALLKQGVSNWNKWRKNNPDVAPDLSKAELSRAYLSEAYLRGAYLSRAYLSGADLSGADLSGAYLSGAYLSRAYLSRAKLSEADLREAYLRGAYLSGANLSEANLIGANLIGANLSEANLIGANLIGANLSIADLSRAKLSGADLSRAKLSGTVFTNAQIGYTIFGDVDLSEVKGLETVTHIAPSTIGMDTIYKSKGNIPHSFLLGAGIPQDDIGYLLALAGKAIDFYSCFISHSSKDKDFVERLHADLQSKGVRCWYADKDLEIGEPILLGIDKGIRYYDKFMIVLSEQSIASHWVEHEFLSASQKEIETGQRVLFPIRVDDAVMKTNVFWATTIKKRHIGDFTHWKDHDSYQKAFDLLLKDLSAKADSTTRTKAP